MPSLDTRWSYLSHSAVILENRVLRVVVLPELGGRIWSIVYKPQDREVLWHNPRITPQRVPFGSAFDNVWCGGWEEMFPTASPSTINGEAFPDHGEVWSLPWSSRTEEENDSVTLHLTCQTPISGVRIEKSLTLYDDESRLELTYMIKNPTTVEVPFLLALHPAMAVSDACRIDFPAMSVEVDPTYRGTLTGVEASFEWPFAYRHGKPVDLRNVCPPSSGEVHFLYGHGYQEGWCAVTDTATRFSVGLTFSPDIFRSCWLFASYGGWRGYYMALLEPCTSYPQQLERAIESGGAATLAAGAMLQTKVMFLAQEGLTCVGGLSSDGKFRE